MHKHTPLLTILAITGFTLVLFSAGMDTCIINKAQEGCPEPHTWHYLPVGVFLAAASLFLARVFRARLTSHQEYGIITAGYVAALSLRFAANPIINHNWYVFPRLQVGIALLVLMFAPLFRSWWGTLLSLSSAAFIVDHWAG